MWKTTILTALCLCFAFAGSTTAPTNATTKTTLTTNSKGTTASHGTLRHKSSSSNPASLKSSTAPTTPTTTPPKINCKVFDCDGENCFKNASIHATDCATETKCSLVKTNGTKIHYKGNCDSACTPGTTANSQTFCCQTANCNTKESTVNPPQGNVGTRSWATSSLVLGSLLTTAFALLL